MSDIAVMGATGHTGSVIARNLLALGHRVRAMGRSAERLDALRQQGAQVHVGDAADPAYLTRAFEGTDAVYAMMPFDPTASGFMALQRTQGQAIVSALQAARVPHVVALSSLGAEQPAGTGVLVSLHEQEQRLATLQHSHVLKLRPAMFYEGLFNLLPGVKYGGSLADAFSPDLPIPMIATRDIADAATTALDQRGWTGHSVRELLGPGDLSHDQLAAFVGEVIGQPGLAYQQLPYEAAAEGMAQAGIAPDLAELLAEMARALNEGRVRSAEGRNAVNTTATPLQSLAPALKQAYDALP